MSQYEAEQMLKSARTHQHQVHTQELEASRIREITDKIRYKDWVIEVRAVHGTVVMAWVFFAKCVNTMRPSLQQCREWGVEGNTEEQIIRTAFAAAKLAEEHECAEHFTYTGRRVFDPHRPVL